MVAIESRHRHKVTQAFSLGVSVCLQVQQPERVRTFFLSQTRHR